MRLERLEIEGYRGFEDKVIIDFPKGNAPMVLVGVNGSGKTAVLEAIVWSLRRIEQQMVNELVEVPSPNGSEVNNNVKRTAKCLLEWAFEQKQLRTGFFLSKSWKPLFEAVGYDELREAALSLRKMFALEPVTTINIPIFTYYSTNRTVIAPSFETKDISRLNQFDAWENAFDGRTNYDNFFQWFRNREDIENEKFKRNGRGTSPDAYLDKQLEAVRNAISSMVDGFSKPYIKRTFPTGFIIDKNGEELSLNQLSYGEKMLLALVGDIARRLALANPALKNPLEGKGVILIDEVDLHLHPSWQRTIVKKLTETFPNIQFVVTTHSELVISHVKKESIYLLKDNDVISWKDQVFNPYGAEPEDILKRIQGVKELLPDEVTMKFKQLFDLIDEDKFDAAKQLKQELEQLVDARHPSLLRAETNMEFKTLID